MTSHLTESMLAAMLEGDDLVPAAVRLHLGECPACRSALEAAESQRIEIGQLLELVTVIQPKIDAVEFLRAVASRNAMVGTDMRTRRTPFRRIARGAVAAGILTASVAAAALVPNSILRRFVRVVAVASGITPRQPSPVPGKSRRSQASPRGVEITPHGRVDVLIRSRQATGVIRIMPASGSDLSVTGTGDGPSYTVGNNTIIVTNHPADSVSFVVGVPVLSESDTVYVRVEQQTVYSNIGNRIIAPVAADSTGQFVLPLQNRRP